MSGAAGCTATFRGKTRVTHAYTFRQPLNTHCHDDWIRPTAQSRRRPATCGSYQAHTASNGCVPVLARTLLLTGRQRWLATSSTRLVKTSLTQAGTHSRRALPRTDSFPPVGALSCSGVASAPGTSDGPATHDAGGCEQRAADDERVRLAISLSSIVLNLVGLKVLYFHMGFIFVWSLYVCSKAP